MYILEGFENNNSSVMKCIINDKLYEYEINIKKDFGGSRMEDLNLRKIKNILMLNIVKLVNKKVLNLIVDLKLLVIN